MRHDDYANCASGTAHNDGENILEAVRAQQRQELQAYRSGRLYLDLTGYEERKEQLAVALGERRCKKS